MIDVLMSGGPVMIPLGLVSLAALAIVIGQLWFLRRSNDFDPTTIGTLTSLLADLAGSRARA